MAQYTLPSFVTGTQSEAIANLIRFVQALNFEQRKELYEQFVTFSKVPLFADEKGCSIDDHVAALLFLPEFDQDENGFLQTDLTNEQSSGLLQSN